MTLTDIAVKDNSFLNYLEELSVELGSKVLISHIFNFLLYTVL